MKTALRLIASFIFCVLLIAFLKWSFYFEENDRFLILLFTFGIFMIVQMYFSIVKNEDL